MECTEYERMYRFEDRHWYFAGKRSLVMSLLKKYYLKGEGGFILDAGCGTGRTLFDLKHLGDVVGMEPFGDAILYAASRGDMPLVQGTLEFPPFHDKTFDAVTMLDVLEHCDDDVQALRSIARVLKPGATVLITVPANQWLWSRHDVALHHRRRYSSLQIEKLLATCGFQTVRISYFNMFVFPLVAGLRLLTRTKDAAEVHADTESMPSGLINCLLNALQWIERVLIARFSLPFGVSLVCVAEKNDDAIYTSNENLRGCQ